MEWPSAGCGMRGSGGMWECWECYYCELGYTGAKCGSLTQGAVPWHQWVGVAADGTRLVLLRDSLSAQSHQRPRPLSRPPGRPPPGPLPSPPPSTWRAWCHVARTRGASSSRRTSCRSWRVRMAAAVLDGERRTGGVSVRGQQTGAWTRMCHETPAPCVSAAAVTLPVARHLLHSINPWLLTAKLSLPSSNVP